jgi:hypothetical protein
MLLVCGPAGVGKSTLGWEISDQLRAVGIAHAVLDSDELDRVWPLARPPRPPSPGHCREAVPCQLFGGKPVSLNALAGSQL